MNIEQRISQILFASAFGTDIISDVISKYKEPNRFYHNLTHIEEMLDFIESSVHDLDTIEFTALQHAIIFHDVIYDTKSKTNEEDSFWYFIDKFKSDTDDKNKMIVMIKEMIMATQYHNYNAQLPTYTQMIIQADLQRLTLPFDQFWNNTKLLMKE